MDNKTTAFPKEFRSPCPISCLLDILGDKWTLLVIRDLFMGKHRYNDFTESPEGIPTNILADRLKRLEATGIVSKQLYQSKPQRSEYFLTPMGADLAPVLGSMLKWAQQHIPYVKVPKRFQQMAENMVS